MKKYSQLGKLMRHQSGVILVYVLVFIAIVALILPPFLKYINTDYKSGQVYQEKASDFYAADAGIQDARWQIQNGGLSTIYLSPNIYNQFDFSANPPWHETGLASTEYGVYYPSSTGVYDVSHEASVNSRNVKVAIKNVWVVSNVNTPDTSSEDTSSEITQAQGIIQTAKLVVVGSDPQGTIDANARKYQLDLTYYPASGENLYVATIGVWLPPGFSYYPVDGTHPFQINGQNYNPGTPAISQFAGGTAVLWTLPSNTLFKNLPGINGSDNPMKAKATFWYRYDKTGQETSTIAQAVGWVTTSGVSSIPYAWDATTHVMELTSTSVSSSATTIDSLVIHEDARPIGGAVNGDYYATGGSVLGGDASYHNQLYNSTTAVVSTTSDPLTGVPSTGTLAAAYLYWSGWIDGGGTYPGGTVSYNPYGANDVTLSPPDTEDGVSFSATPGPVWTNGGAWTANFNNTGSSRVFKTVGVTTATGASYLTSAIIPMASYVGKTVNISFDLMRTSTTMAATDYLQVMISTNGTWTQQVCKILGTDANLSTTSHTYVFTLPAAYVTATTQIRFITALSSTSKTFYLDNIKFVNPKLFYDDCSSLANWTQSGATWTLSSNQFKAVGGGTAANSYLTMTNSINLGAYSGVSLAISWNNVSDTFTSSDHLYFSFSGDGGTTWSADTECLNSTMKNGYASFLIPSTPVNYKTSTFKMRYKITAPASSSNVVIDTIAISGPTLEYPTNATSGSVSNLVEKVAKVNQVKFGSTSGNLQTVTATTYQVLPTLGTGYEGTWAYTAMFDATSLIKGWITAGQVTASGAATYTFGHAFGANIEDANYSKSFSGGGSTGYPLASPTLTQATPYNYTYGSWSLVLIYSSPQTAGHQLWLFDILNPNFVFSEAWNGAPGQERTNPDFDGDGVDGGIISGFLVPQGIADQANSSKITVFVGEGDASISGDSFQVNGTKLTNGVSTDPNNVWDWKSQPLPSSGGDIDTFYVNYPVIQPGDTSAHIDLPTASDGFTLIFIIISFRSDSVIGGAITYLIR